MSYPRKPWGEGIVKAIAEAAYAYNTAVSLHANLYMLSARGKQL